jgi:hypothetical protein
MVACLILEFLVYLDFRTWMSGAAQPCMLLSGSCTAWQFCSCLESWLWPNDLVSLYYILLYTLCNVYEYMHLYKFVVLCIIVCCFIQALIAISTDVLIPPPNSHMHMSALTLTYTCTHMLLAHVALLFFWYIPVAYYQPGNRSLL